MIRLTPTDASRRAVGAFLDEAEALAAPDADAVRPFQEAIRAGFDFQFTSEGAAGGAPWAALAAFTRRERRRLGFPPDHPILQRTGAYRASFSDEGHPLHVSDWSVAAGVWHIEEGSKDPRADELEFGRSNMPARPVTILGAAGEARLAMVAETVFASWFED